MEMVKGETVIIRQEYDLFDNQMNGQRGIYLKTNEETGKHLIYFPQVQEFGEIKEIERVNQGVIEEHHKNIVSRIVTLEYNADEKLRLELENRSDD